MSEKETLGHVDQVRRQINYVISALNIRAALHDKSKLEEPEASTFDRVTGALKGLTYGSPEYYEQLKEMKPALDHHYANNRHHPEHFESGMVDMNLIDLIEMFCDWYAATKRHADGDIHKSVDLNAKRFGYGSDLISIFHNTADWLMEQPRNDKQEEL